MTGEPFIFSTPPLTSLLQHTLLSIKKEKMHVTSLAVIGLCAGLSAAAQQASASAFDITNLSTHQVTGGNTTLEFTIHDPDPLTNTTTTCTGTWAEGTDDYPSPGYVSHLFPLLPPQHTQP